MFNYYQTIFFLRLAEELLFSALKLTIISLVAIIYLSLPAYGFYEYQGEKNSIDLRGFVRFFGAFNINPKNKAFYENSTDISGGGIGRLLLDAQIGEHAALEFNGYQFFNSTTAAAVAPDSQGTSLGDAERSSALEWNQHDDSETVANLAVDRLSIRLSHEQVDIFLGRQPINLATAFYFTPNDFFSPFTAQTFFRIYKSGVDAARAEFQIGELTQLSLIGVLGYDPDSSSSNGWSQNPAWDRSSLLARITATEFNLEWALLSGTVTNKNIIGASLQGDLFDWLGVRAEGHYAIPVDNKINNYFELTIGLEHRFPNDINLRGEFFHHGTGKDSIDDYEEGRLTLQSTLPYLSRWYTAIGVGYQTTPLLQIDGVVITNLIDRSNLLSLNAVYSLSDEADLSIGFLIPVGKQTKNNSDILRSEFGLYPYSAYIEVRMYF